MSRIANPGYVLKSTTPSEHKTTAETNAANRATAGDRMQAYAESVIPGGEAWAYQTDTGAMSMTGIKVPHGVKVDEVPTGWRWDTKAKRDNRILVPAKKTDEGKRAVTDMAAMAHKPTKLGPVSEVMTITNGTSRWFASAIIEILGDDVFATYFHPLDDEQRMGRPSDRERVEADPAWTPVPLSEFYAAREQHTAEKAGA